MKGAILVGLGVWLFSDAVYSTVLYLHAPAWNGEPRQTWKWDHSIRIVRGLCALAVIVIGAGLE